ncbi:TIGR01440 family protein [Miniphocaeibacter halophilus]|uniref:TIGR01440 family protein n=1 Tax=Miniphocaeibacter halophilus TaxID=2931922 RepID=A0AC61MPS7_9FIRM|nr:TIGR01440 family protein [Miniphocaeibacter halophilus]QQK07183.1 TIGR01440 family protein [Miniphocaeibacter halophilus]
MLKIKSQIEKSFESLKEQCNFEEGNILVVGCSSSEIIGSKIGTNSSYEVGETVAKTLLDLCEKNNIYLAAQCCEHLNRALVVEKEVAEKFGFEIVTVVPKPKAGGSFATAVYSLFKEPVVVEYIKADYGMDIGLTMIGMHMKHVCIPLRLNPNTIGETIVTGAKIRPKLIGGARAEYL